MAGNKETVVVDESSWEGGAAPLASDTPPDESDINIADGSLKGIEKSLQETEAALSQLDAPANTSDDDEPLQALPDQEGTMGDDEDENESDETRPDSEKTAKQEEDEAGKQGPASAVLTPEESKIADTIKEKLISKYPNLLKRYKDAPLEEILTNYDNGVDNLLYLNDRARSLGVSRDQLRSFIDNAVQTHLAETAKIAQPANQPVYDEAVVKELAEELVISEDSVRKLLKTGALIARQEMQPVMERLQTSAQIQQEQESQAMWNGFWSKFSTAEATKVAAETIGKDGLWDAVKEYEAEFPGGCAKAVQEGKNPLDVALKYHLLQGKNFDLWLKMQGVKGKSKPVAPPTQRQTGAGSSPAFRGNSLDDDSLPNVAKQLAQLTGDKSWLSYGKV